MKFSELKSKIDKTSNEFQLRTLLEKYIQEKTNIEGLWEKERVDLLYKNLLIETKKLNYLSNNTNLKTAIEERIYPYMRKVLVKYGVLTDGVSIYFFEMDKELNIKEIKTPIGNQFNEANIDFLINLIIEEKEIYLSPDNLVAMFGNPENNVFIKNILKEFYSFFINDKSIKKTLLFQEWDKLFKISEETNNKKEEVKRRRKALSKIFDVEISKERDESEALFVMHNVLSIILKLLIYNNFLKIDLLQKLDIKNDFDSLKTFIRRLENGEFFYSLGIYNLIIYDYFSWYADEHIKWNESFKNIIYELIQAINKIVPLRTEDTIDYVEELYRKYIPKEIRHSFGEFFTPHIIAKEVVENIAQIKPDESVIDPTCGSGTFLIETLKIKKKGNLTIEEILNSLCGIDLNPINVLLSKFNIISNLLDRLNLVNNTSKQLIIPVFIGDSSYVPIIDYLDNIKIVRYNWLSNVAELEKIPEIILPVDFIKQSNFFEIMEKVKELIEKEIDNSKFDDKAANFLIEKIKECEVDIKTKLITEDLETKIRKWILCIRNYHKNNLNSIWIFIFIGYLYPFIFTYDKVIGNPPWVRWSNLPTFYKEKIKHTLREKGLFSSDKNTGGVDLNIYALITYNAIVYLLKENGKLTFLLPKSSLQNKSLEGFRRLCFYEYAKIEEPLYFSEGKIFEEVDLDFVIVTLKKQINNIKNIN